MGRASSSKKVAKAAKAGAKTASGQNRSLAFPAALVVTCVLGIALVLFARDQRTASASIPPLLGDHWHSAYAMLDCGDFLAPLSDTQNDALGIHSHDDGLIHIHPFSSQATGDNATLGVFFDEVGLEASDDEMRLADGTVLANGDECAGEEGQLVVAKWSASDIDAEPEIITENFDDVRLDADGQAFTIGLIAPGTTPPPPLSVSALGSVGTEVDPLDLLEETPADGEGHSDDEPATEDSDGSTTPSTADPADDSTTTTVADSDDG